MDERVGGIAVAPAVRPCLGFSCAMAPSRHPLRSIARVLAVLARQGAANSLVAQGISLSCFSGVVLQVVWKAPSHINVH